MQKKQYYYCDMDGVIADFNNEPNAVARFAVETGFFFNLKPIQENVNFIKQLIASGESVRILSASPNKQADADKRAWLKKYLPELPAHKIIIMRCGENKHNYIKTKTGVLFDDYGKNCREWEAHEGCTAIKVEGLIRL